MKDVRSVLGWFGLWGTAFASSVWAIGNVGRTLGQPSPAFWTDNAAIVNPILFVAGMWALLLGPINSIRLTRQLRRVQGNRHIEALSHQLLITAHELCPGLQLEALAVHPWQVNGDRLERLLGYRIERRKDSGVIWTKGRGAVGVCWETGQDVEADLTGLHVPDEATFVAIPADHRFNITWHEYLSTSRYWSIFVTPLKDAKGKFIGCVSVDCTQRDVHQPFIDACNNRQVTGLVSLLELALRDL